MTSSPNSLNGYLIVDKPDGLTSHDIVAAVRRCLKLYGHIRVGHTGTLDPFATGLLLVTIGSATRLTEYTSSWPKTYEATITLSGTSTTDDRTGEITAGSSYRPTQAEIEQVLSQFLGTQQQVPPIYAAIKVQGQKLYEYARRGETVIRTPRSITIHNLALVSYSYPTLEIRVTCSTGTYIRALARDIGEKLGSGAHVAELRRTQIGPIDVKNALQVTNLTTELVIEAIRPMQDLVQMLPVHILSPENVAQLRQGRAVELSTEQAPTTAIALYTTTQKLFGIGQIKATSPTLLSPLKILS